MFMNNTNKMKPIIQRFACENAEITEFKLSSVRSVNKVKPTATRKMINKLILYFLEAFDFWSFISNFGDSFICIIISPTELVYYSIGTKLRQIEKPLINNFNCVILIYLINVV